MTVFNPEFLSVVTDTAQPCAGKMMNTVVPTFRTEFGFCCCVGESCSLTGRGVILWYSERHIKPNTSDQGNAVAFLA